MIINTCGATYRESKFEASSGSTSMPKSLKASINSSKSTLPKKKICRLCAHNYTAIWYTYHLCFYPDVKTVVVNSFRAHAHRTQILQGQHRHFD